MLQFSHFSSLSHRILPGPPLSRTSEEGVRVFPEYSFWRCLPVSGRMSTYNCSQELLNVDMEILDRRILSLI